MNTDPFISDLMKEFESIKYIYSNEREDDLDELNILEELFIKATATLAFNRIPDAYTDHASRDENTSSVWILGALFQMHKNRGNLVRARLSLNPALLERGELFDDSNRILALCSKLMMEIQTEIIKYDRMIVTYENAQSRRSDNIKYNLKF